MAATVTLMLVLLAAVGPGHRLMAVNSDPLRVAPAAQKGLKIVVIAGEDAVNVIQQKTAVSPVVEVRDENDLPVAGALVTFTVGGGKNAVFAGGAQTMTVTTNAAGRAVAAGLNPLGSGAVQINIQAAFQGQTAVVTISQSNVATAAQAAQVSGGSGSGSGTSAGSGASGSGGGGLSNLTLTSIIAGAAGAGTLVALNARNADDPEDRGPIVNGADAFPSIGLQASTTISFTWSGEVQGTVSGRNATEVWEFGDGATMTLPINTTGGPRPPGLVTHVYSTAGTFTVRVTVTDEQNRSASGQGTVTIKSMTGRWTLGTTANFYDLTQSGTTIAGVFSAGPGVRRVSGSIETASPRVRFSETAPLPGNPTVITFTGDPSADVNTVTGVLNGGGFPPNTTAGISRQ